MKRILAVCGLALLTSCSTAQNATFQSSLQTACGDAMAVANIAGLVPGVGAIIPYINAGCATAEGIAKLAADPSSAEWVGTLIGSVKSLAANVGMKLP